MIDKYSWVKKMKDKLIGLLISIMLLTTILVAAKPVDKMGVNTTSKTVISSSSMADVPVWQIGDVWTYQVDDISFNFSSETQSVFLSASIAELPLEVTDTTGDFYTLSFETTMDGQGHIYADQGDGPVNIEVTLTSLEISGTVRIEKSTLGIKDITISFDKQKLTFNIIDQPYLPLPSWLRIISAKITSDVDVNCDTSIALLSFPLNTGVYWNLTATNFSVDGQIQSFFFKVIYFLNNFAKLFGKGFLPLEVAALLPVIDINEALTTFLGGNVFQIPAFAKAFFCPNTETINIPAGTYEAYNITLMSGVGQCYYAPTAGNVIKLTGNFQYIIPLLNSIDMVLLSTTYS